MSPRLAHAILVMFNYRRNIRMAVQHAGLSRTFSGFYSQYHIEAVQELTAGWFVAPLFQGWLSTRGFKDTGERTGLAASVTLDTGTFCPLLHHFKILVILVAHCEITSFAGERGDN